MKSITKKAILILAAAFLFVQCSGEKSGQSAASAEEHEHADAAKASESEVTTPEFSVDQNFQKQLNEVFKQYLALKESFVASDPAKVAASAAQTMVALSKVDMKLVTDKAHTAWMAYQSELSKSLAGMSQTTDIEAEREHFSNLSNSMYKVIKAYGLGGGTAYYEFCPMALNDKGAYWLSDDKKIRNPYFGDKMLTCGSVEETLK